MRRSSYEEIIDWKNRRGDQPRLGMELVAQIQALGATAEAIAAVEPVYIDFIPIRLVTTIEVFLRGVIAELVDTHETYFERGEKLVKGAKIDLAFAFHVNRRALSTGDFVAHAVSLNSIESVMKIMDTLLGGFESKLKASYPRWTEEAATWPLAPIVADYDKMIAAMARLYEIRHILTHELPGKNVLSSAEVPNLVDAAKVFVDATDWVVVEALHGSVPRTQLAMIIDANNDLHQEETALTRAIDDILELDGVDNQALSEMQGAWEHFARLQASFVASQVEGGTMYPMMLASEKAALLRERISQLGRIKKDWVNG